MDAYIQAVAHEKGSLEVSNADIVRDFPDWSEQKISVKIGIDRRYVAEGETASDLAYKAAVRLIEANGLNRSSVDALILCTQSPDYFLPTTACILQDRLGLRTDIMAFDYNLGCSGYVYGLGISKSLIVAGMAKNVLLLTADTYNRYIDKGDRGNRSLFSDAASATLISADKGIFRIGNPVYGTDGSGYQNLIVKGGGSRYPDESARSLFMDGPAIFNFTLEAVPPLVEETLKKNNWEFDEVDCFIFHQANKHMLKYIRGAIHIPEDKFYLCLQNYGNTVSSTLPICLDHFIQEARVKNGGKYLLAGFGVGYSWGAITLDA